MVEIISKRYVALIDTENVKLSRLLTPDYLRSVLRKPDDNLKIEYCSRTENAYMVMTVLPVEWHADGTVSVIMQVVQDIGQKVELENMANTDGLTGLFNERYFSRVLNICEAKKLPFVLYYLDLDRFKPINDTYGHAMGDRLLKEISARLLRCIRSRDYAFRIGGDEFALIVSADMDEEQRSRMAERIQTMLSAPIVIEEKVLSVGVSCGCACYPEDGDASQVRITADSRMYTEKQHHHEDDRTDSRFETQNPAVRRRDSRPAADRGNADVPHCRTASARAGQGCFPHSIPKLVSADGRRAARGCAPGHASAAPEQTLAPCITTR